MSKAGVRQAPVMNGSVVQLSVKAFSGLLMIIALGCSRDHPVRPPLQTQEHRFPVDVVLTAENLYWSHFTPKDYFNPVSAARFEVWIVGTYNKSGNSPGLYGWLRVTFADSAGIFDNEFYYDNYRLLLYNSHLCPAFLPGGDSLVTAFLGSADPVFTLGGGPGTGYSIHLELAAGVSDVVSDSACTAEVAVSLADTLHIVEIIYEVSSQVNR